MTEEPNPQTIERVPIDSIYILNPRERDKTKFRLVVDSIAAVGLKRPIKVSMRADTETDAFKFNLVCGQGRLEAFKALGETHIPAVVVELSNEDCYLQSLVENFARRQHSSLELLRDIGALEKRGYSPTQISEKTGLSRDYVIGILRLINEGEERLVAAVERNQIPLSVAIEISSVSHEDAQAALHQAYERKELRGQKLQTAIRIINQRERWGRRAARRNPTKSQPLKTSHAMVRAYKRETERQRILIKKADLTENRLLVISSALRTLLSDEHFRTLLRAEGLDSIPTQVASMLKQDGAKA